MGVGVASSATFRTPRPGVTGSIAFGVVLASLTIALGGSVILSRPTVWQSQTTLLVMPRETDDGSDAGLFELLNQGQIVTTYAAILRSNVFAQDVARSAAVTVRPITLDAAPLPDTFLIRITATAPTAVDSARLARAGARRAPAHVADLKQPFAIRALDASGVTATRRTVATPGLAVTLFLIALIVGVAGQQAFLQLRRLQHAKGTARQETRARRDTRAGPERRAGRSA